MDAAFTVIAEDKTTRARRGRLVTAHGVVDTPVFMPVATKGAVRTLTPRDVQELGANMVLANAYHLYLRPGLEPIRKLGGLHSFMAWNGSILTDSGGYQIFSLSKFSKVNDDGVEFRSLYDGSSHFLTPEDVIEIQEALGADIAMVLDECPPYPIEKGRAEKAVQRTLEWSRRCIRHKRLSTQALFGIIQGGVYPDLRRLSVEQTLELDLPGYAIGGLSVGEPKEQMHEVVELTTGLLPKDKPRYLMGVGDPEGLLRAIGAGVDMFDCAYPTRVARNGMALTATGSINLRNAQLKADDRRLDPSCDCQVCASFSRAYLRHLYNTGEILAHRLLTHHNLFHILGLVSAARKAIGQGSFAAFCADQGLNG